MVLDDDAGGIDAQQTDVGETVKLTVSNCMGPAAPLPSRCLSRQAAAGTAFALLVLALACLALLVELRPREAMRSKMIQPTTMAGQSLQFLVSAAQERSAEDGPLTERVLRLAANKSFMSTIKAPAVPRMLNDGWRQGTCFINVLIATEKLALLGLQIDSSVRGCAPKKQAHTNAPTTSHVAGSQTRTDAMGVFPKPEDVTGPQPQIRQLAAAVDKPEVCAGDVTGVYASFCAAGAYISSIAATCPESIDPALGHNANCAADILNINYGAGTLASAFATINDVCTPEKVNIRKPNPDAPHDVYSNRMGQCVVNAAEAAGYVGNAVLHIHNSVVECPDAQKYNRDATCAAQISGVVQSISLIAAYLSNAATLCGATAINAAKCSNRVGSIVAGCAEIADGASGASFDCVPEPKMPFISRPAR